MTTINLRQLTSVLLMWISIVESADVNQYYSGVDWLSRYGYLSPPDPRVGRLQTKEGIEQAIREMQRFGGIEQTGKLDRETLELMRKPRCSLPDIMGSEDVMKKRRRRKRYALSGLQWRKKMITWSISNGPELSRNLQQSGLVKDIMAYALRAWSDVTPLEFQQAQTGAEPDLAISFARSHHEDGYPFDGPGGTLAHAFFPGDSPISGDTHFDDDETWGYRDGSGQSTDLFTVAVHEFGHALGLGHSAVPDSIMAPYYSGPVAPSDIRSYRLPLDDQQAIQQVYGSREKNPTLPNVTPRLPDLPNPTPAHGTPMPDPTVKDRCGGSFDAVANIRGEVFFFKGKFFWRMEHSGSLLSLAPAQIKNFWFGLPDDIKKIDAVYERSDNSIIFFSGHNYWVFKNTNAQPGYPRPITDFKMTRSDGSLVSTVEAAFVWAHNGRTFLFSGGEFWRFSNGNDAHALQPDEGYPKAASLWKGMPTNPDDIISYGEGDTYFFKENSYWKIEKGRLDQEEVKEKSTAIDWMQCPKEAVPTSRPGKGNCVCSISGAAGYVFATRSPSVLFAALILAIMQIV